MLRSSLVHGALAVVLTASAFVAHAVDPLRVEESVRLAATPARAWAAVADFKGLADWHPAVATTEIVAGENNRPGAVRAILTRDGAQIVEELLGYDGDHRSMRYRIIDSPLPVADYVATLSVEASGSGARVVWKSEFHRDVNAPGIDDAKARELIAGIYQAGFAGLRDALGEGQPAAR